MSLSQVHSAQIVVSNCQFRVRPKCRQVMAFRLLQISIRKKSVREEKLSERVIRIEPDDLAVLGNRAVEIAFDPEAVGASLAGGNLSGI